MMFSAIFLLALPAVALSAGALSGRIVGGVDVNIADYPYQGSYRTAAGSHTCGCIYVGGVFSLTAGHCGGTSAYTMEFGNSDRGAGPYTSISGVIRHPEYDVGAGFTPNDVSVVTSPSIAGSPTAASIPSDASNPGGIGQISGWGRTCGGCSLPVTLQATDIPIIADSACQAEFGDSFQSDIMICVYNAASNDVGSCNGDSGGPLYQNGNAYGITSWGYVGCPTTAPSVYAKTGAFRDFICANAPNAQGC